jgi:putative transposase
MFCKEAGFEAFERVIVETHEQQPIRILSYCVLSNHWHFVVWPEETTITRSPPHDPGRLN